MRYLVTNVSQMATLAGPAKPRVGPELEEIGLMDDAAMLVAAGRIEWVGLRKDAPDCDYELDAERGVVLPGFVDAHTHLVFAGSRIEEFEARSRGATYEDIAATGGGIQSTVRLTREASEDGLLDSALNRLAWCHACGTTTVEIKSGYGLDFETELKMLRVIRRIGEKFPVVPTFLGAHACPAEVEQSEHVDKLCTNSIVEVARERLAHYVDVFVEDAYFQPDEARAIALAAHEAGLQMRMHVDQLTNNGGAFLAAELHAKTADHLEQTEQEGIQALAEAGVQPVLLPASVLGLGKAKYPDARAMIDAGCAVVLATDFNPGSSPCPSIPLVMTLACTHMKMSPAEALSTATFNAACSIDLELECGSLESGKRADFTIWPTRDWREVIYYFGHQRASATYIGGEFVDV